MAIFKKDEGSKSAWGVADPLKRQFLAGFFIGCVVGIAVGGLLSRHFG